MTTPESAAQPILSTAQIIELADSISWDSIEWTYDAQIAFGRAIEAAVRPAGQRNSDDEVLAHALAALTRHFDAFVGDCMDAIEGLPMAPSRKALAQARACLPSSCANSFKPMVAAQPPSATVVADIQDPSQSAPVSAPVAPTADRPKKSSIADDPHFQQLMEWRWNADTVEQIERADRALIAYIDLQDAAAAPLAVPLPADQIEKQYPVADCGPNPVTWTKADVTRLDAALGGMWDTSTAVVIPQAAPGEVQSLTEQQEPKYGGTLFNRASGEAIPTDEPVFIFRARDRHAVAALGFYAGDLANASHFQAVRQRIIDFKAFTSAHPERMKEPDTAPAQTGEGKQP